uniref:Uncharacterized protein n=1 Tax=Tanacetum cinerariifolium TaxID=118510 RepID=A0A699HP44_TANCI|nr:hypothetical protein [Tanacetum cinerariifolium]
MFLKYSTSQIPPKKSRGKGSYGKKTSYTPVADVNVSEESEPTRKRTASRRVVKKKVIISTANNIIPNPDVALELGKSINLTEAANIMKALKESKKPSKRQPGTEGSSEGIGSIPGVSDESTVISATSSEGTEREYSKEDQSDDEEDNWIDSDEDVEKKDDIDGDKSIDLKMTDDEETEDEFVYDDEQVNDDEDEKMSNTEVEDSGKGDEEIYDVAKEDAKKIEEIKDDAKKANLPPTSSSLFVSSDAEINSLLDVKIQYEVPHIQSPPILTVPVSMIFEPSVLTPVQETPSVVHVTTLPHQTMEPIPTPLITTDAPTIIIVPESDPALESSKIQILTINLEHESEKSASEICKIKKELAEKQKMPKYTIKSTDKATLKEYDLKSALYQTMHQNKSFNRNVVNHALYHALMEALIEYENAMYNRFTDTVKNHKRQHHDDDDDDEEDPLPRPNQGKKTKRRRTKELESSKKPYTTKETPKGKAPLKGSKTGKFVTAKEPVEEPIAEVVMDDAFNTAGEDVVRNDDQPQDTSKPKIDKTSNPDCHGLTKWSLLQRILSHLMISWPLRLTSPNKLYWNNPEEDRYPFDLSKPLPLQGRPSHLNVFADYFFNKDLEFLTTFDLKKTYTTFITKTKAPRYEIMGLKDMTLVLWSTIKHAVKKLHGYGHLEEIMVKRVDRQLYKFKEGDDRVVM